MACGTGAASATSFVYIHLETVFPAIFYQLRPTESESGRLGAMERNLESQFDVLQVPQ